MILLYNFFIFLFRIGLLLATPFHAKARQFVSGRRGLFKKLSRDLRKNTSPLVWIHCASLGEFEQGRPIIEALKKDFSTCKILLTFFSPSGFEVRKNYSFADYVYYLPLDTASNARRFVSITQPTMAIFVKYEFWHYFAKELSRKKIPLISISAIFRKDQIFFQSYGRFFRNILKKFAFFFVQNDESVRLLKSIDIANCQRTGDTRFDRVLEIVEEAKEIDAAKKFKSDQKLMVIGSCWPEDMEVLNLFINENRLKFIIAPHEISESSISGIEKSIQIKSIRYSAIQNQNLDEYQVLIIDNIGMLSQLYQYGEFAYVGGAFGKGLHNILEAACYGVPIFFGNKNYVKFQEATDLINRGGAFEISDYTDLKTKYHMLNVPENFLLACAVTRQYVEENLGATEKIMKYCHTRLKI